MATFWRLKGLKVPSKQKKHKTLIVGNYFPTTPESYRASIFFGTEVWGLFYR